MTRQPVTRHHAEWLSLVEVSGPFLSLPVLARALPQGLEAVSPDTVATLRRAYDEWQADPALHGQWVCWVLGSLLGFREGMLAEGPAVPTALAHAVPEHGETVRPDLAVLEPSGDRPVARLLVAVWPHGQRLDARLADTRWAATPLDRMVDLLRGAGVRVGLVTNGERWTLVDAPRGQTSGFATWEAGIWVEERSTLNAFVTLLGAHRFFSVPETDTLEALLAESANAQQEVTDQLGRQVRAAVEMLVDAFSRVDRERGGRLLGDLDPRVLYQGALTTMMRLVFLLAAEERDLFLLGDQLYDQSYAVSTLRGQLQEEADRFGEEPLERRHAAWQRLLATFRMVYGGVQHEQLRLPAYGGGLFDPDRFPFLEGRKPGVDAAEEPVPIDDRTVLHLLDALQVLRRKGRGAGPVEAQRLSYRALDVEQIGHVYEGLLDHTAVRVDDPAVGFDGKLEPEVSLRLVEEAAARGREALVAWLREETGESRAWVERRLDAEIEAAERQRLLIVCDNDKELAERVAPFGGLLRRDLRGDPIVYLPGSTYVTKASERRSSGTYYTPRSLAEEVVRHTLDPLVHRPGPAEGAEPADWRLRPSSELLAFKVCDMAMGSGAFLVAACRYLADRLVEAWTAEQATAVAGPGGGEVALPAGPEEQVALALRLVADRCLYGVDKNSMAVEMAKLSMWLVTLAKGRPFTFLDHTLRCGDSLLGITSVDQLVNLHPDPGRGRDLHFTLAGDMTAVVAAAVERAAELRRRIAATPVLDVRDADEKERLLTEAVEATEALRTVADLVVGAALSTAGAAADAIDNRLAAVAPKVAAALDASRRSDDRAVTLFELRVQASEWLQAGKPPLEPDRQPFHWPLEFAEVFVSGGGLDAVVGNPPFLGGTKISTAMGQTYRNYLSSHVAGHSTDRADLVVFFLLRAASFARQLGLICTNTISEGDSREAGLDRLVDEDWRIVRADKSAPWPGEATLEVARVWLHRGSWNYSAVLDDQVVSLISSSLESAATRKRSSKRLVAYRSDSFQGSKLDGMGFVLDPEEAKRLLADDPRNQDVILPYINGEDVNKRPDQTPSRFAINFFDWPLERASQYTRCLSRVERLVKPERARHRRAAHRDRWWHYGDKRPALYAAIAGLNRVIVITSVSKTVMPVMLPTGIIYSHALFVFSYDDNAHFGLLSSGFHYWWAVTHASTMRTDVRYTPTDCFETFPQPTLTEAVSKAGGALDTHRRALMLDRWEGLTKTYNRVHDPAEHAEGIVELRRLHVELDHAVAVAYGWDDLPMDHDFHETRQGIRYTFSPTMRTELLDRLLELNHQRAAAEAAAGVTRQRRGGARRRRPADGQTSLEAL
jgi:methylase of polypeptide subunit release factors